MGQRRGLLIVVVAVVGAAILVCGRCAASDDPPDDSSGAPTGPGPAAEADASDVDPPGGQPEQGTPESGSLDATPASPGAPHAPHDHSGVTVEETLAPASQAEATTVAAEFARAWAGAGAGADRAEQLSRLATPSLAASLTSADPPRPAPAEFADPVVWLAQPQWARIAVDTDRGTLVLDVITGDDSQWRVSAVDWRPA